MSLIVKFGVASLAVGAASLATLPHSRLVEVPALMGLSGLFGATASPITNTGPVDQSFNAHHVSIDKLVAQLDVITVAQPGPIRIQASGTPDMMKDFRVRAVGDDVVIRLDKAEQEEAWFPWSLFNLWSQDRKARDLRVQITAPAGTPFDIDEMVGVVRAGDLDAPLSMSAMAVEARFGRVQSAKIVIEGSGRIAVGVVKETIDAKVEGSGTITAAAARDAQVSIEGVGDVTLGPLVGGLSADVEGSGDIRVAKVAGPVSIDIEGSGDVAVESGQASPFSVQIDGSGDVVFKGHAINPKISIEGSGDVTVGSYSGALSQSIDGSGTFKVLNQGAPQPAPVPAPQPPAPPVPPTPPKKF